MKKIVVFSEWFLPAYKAGGPIRSIANLVKELECTYKVYVVTGNTDFGDGKSFENIEPNKWILKGGYSAIYLDKEHQSLTFYRGILKEINPDWIYLNSLFSLKFTLFPLLIAKKRNEHSRLLLAPRGMLGTGALSIKPLKKAVFLKVSKLLGLFNNLTWHATSNGEAGEIKTVFPGASIFQAPNFSDHSNFPVLAHKLKVPGFLKMFFVSRISSKKNLHFALEIIKQLPEIVNLEFYLFGPVEDDGYWKVCKKLIEEINLNRPVPRVSYVGEIRNEDLFQNIAAYHLFFLPTLNENFGHAIVEAFKNGSPVVISDQTPWNQLAAKGIGYDIPLSQPEAFVKAIEHFALMDQKTFNEWSQRAYSFSKEITNNRNIRRDYVALFNS